MAAHVVCAVVGMARPAQSSDDPRAARCVAAYELGQQQRREGKLSAAQVSLRTCNETCPTRFSRDCQRWMAEVEQLIPTVRLRAVDEGGRAVRDARVLIDGKLFRDTIPSEPVPVDPGDHAFRFERAGAVPVDIKVGVHPGERERPIDVTFSMLKADPPAREMASSESGNRPVAYAFGIAGLAALGVSGVLLVKGHVDRGQLQDCKPDCKPEDVDAVRTLWWASAASAGIGVLSLGIAYWQWPRTLSPANGRISFVPMVGGLAIRAEIP